MLQRYSRPITYLIGFMLADAILSLFFFWSAQLSYGIWITGSSVAFPVAVRYGEAHWHGPQLLTLIAIGELVPLITFLPYAPLFLWLKKCPVWVKGGLCLLWLGEIVALGFFIPWLPLLS